MTLYIFLFILCIVFAFRDHKNKYGILIILLLLFFSMFRGENVGDDTTSYYNNTVSSDIVLTGAMSYDMEYIYVYVVNYISTHSLPPRYALFFLSIITFVFLFLACKSFKSNISLVCLFFYIGSFYFLSLNIARQMAAVSILLYAYSFLCRNDKTKYLFFFWVGVAGMIHLSSWFFILAYLALFIPDGSKKSKFLFAPIIVLLFVLIQFTKETMLNSLFTNMNYIDIYSRLGEETKMADRSFVGMFFSVFYLIADIYIYYRIRELGDKTFAKIFFLVIILRVLFSAFYGNIGRMFYSIDILSIIAFEKFYKIKSLKINKNDSIVFYLLIIFYSYSSLAGIAGGAYSIVPYYLTF